MIEKLKTFVKNIINDNSGATVVVNNSSVINGENLSDELEILGEKLKVDRHFSIDITFNGTTPEISTVNGNITINCPAEQTQIDTIETTNGDVTVKGKKVDVKKIKTTNGDINL